MNNNSINFRISGKDVFVDGYPELEGKKGFMVDEGMAFFHGKGDDNLELFIANTQTGKIRKLASASGNLLVDDNDIDYDSISKKCKRGINNAKNKSIRYSSLSRWDRFKNGICAITWMLYPEGGYFADSDGFGGDSCNEEVVYAIIDTNLNIIEPFRPVYDIDEYLSDYRKKYNNQQKNNKEMKTRIFNLIIIDESGSMMCIKKETVNNVNETIQTIKSAQKKHDGQEHYITLVTFNNEVKTICSCVPVTEVKELTDETYDPYNSTALYDAIGFSVSNLSKYVSENDKVLVTIVTDGYENSSVEYKTNDIKHLINKYKGKGWVFAFIGANQDVTAAASSISITNTMKFEATSTGTAEMGAAVDAARFRLYGKIANDSFCAQEANINFFDEKE